MSEVKVYKKRESIIYAGFKPEGSPDFYEVEYVLKSAYDALKVKNEILQKWIDSDNTIDQRDEHEDRINEIANALGDQSDWSNMNDRGENALELVYELKARLAECEKALKEYRPFSLTSEGCGPYENLRFPAEEYFKKWGGDETKN